MVHGAHVRCAVRMGMHACMLGEGGAKSGALSISNSVQRIAAARAQGRGGWRLYAVLRAHRIVEGRCMHGRARRHLPIPPHPALSCMHGLPRADVDTSQLRLPPRSIWVRQGWCCRGRCWRGRCFARRARRDFAGAAAAFIRGALRRSQLHGCSAVLASQPNGGYYQHPAGASLSRSRCSRCRLG